MSAFGYTSPSGGLGGDGDADDSQAESLWRKEAGPGTWQPECWSKSPEQLIEEARAMDLAAFQSAAAGAARRQPPPLPPNRLRTL